MQNTIFALTWAKRVWPFALKNTKHTHKSQCLCWASRRPQDVALCQFLNMVNLCDQRENISVSTITMNHEVFTDKTSSVGRFPRFRWSLKQVLIALNGKSKAVSFFLSC